MAKDILTVLQSGSNRFSKGQRLIANYIMEYYDQAAFMTASKLGKAVGVSESTVVRFATELGYEGYPEMQKTMQEAVLNRLTAAQRIEVSNSRLGDQDAVSTTMQSDVEKLRQTMERLNREEFAAAVDGMLNARRIYLLGVRSVAPLAQFLGYYLSYIFDDVRLVTSAGEVELFEQLIGVGPEDVVLAISFPRYSSVVVTGAQFCRDAGAKVIALTDSEESPLGTVASHVLLAKSDMVSMVDSLVAPLSVINALLVALSGKRKDSLVERLERLEQVWDEYQVYGK